MYFIVGKNFLKFEKKKTYKFPSTKKQKCSRKKKKLTWKNQMGSFRIFGRIFALPHKILENNIRWRLDKLDFKLGIKVWVYQWEFILLIVVPHKAKRKLNWNVKMTF